MKTLTTTLSIFALLLSSTAFSLDLNSEITPPLGPERPRFTNVINDEEITPPLGPERPRFSFN